MNFNWATFNALNEQRLCVCVCVTLSWRNEEPLASSCLFQLAAHSSRAALAGLPPSACWFSTCCAQLSDSRKLKAPLD